MTCNNCGNHIADEAVFCTSCGVRVNREQPPVITNIAGVTDNVPVSENIPTYSTESADAYTAPMQPVQNMQPVQDMQPVQNMPAEKPKTFFGVGALVLCLVVIALLSISTGVFAGLYFTLC